MYYISVSYKSVSNLWTAKNAWIAGRDVVYCAVCCLIMNFVAVCVSCLAKWRACVCLYFDSVRSVSDLYRFTHENIERTRLIP